MNRLRLRIVSVLCPATHKVVPVEPTNAMLRAAAKAMSPGRRPTQEWVSVGKKHAIRYKAMIEAAH